MLHVGNHLTGSDLCFVELYRHAVDGGRLFVSSRKRFDLLRLRVQKRFLLFELRLRSGAAVEHFGLIFVLCKSLFLDPFAVVQPFDFLSQHLHAFLRSFRCLRCGVKLLFKVHLIARFLFKLAVQFGYLVTQLAQFLLCFGRIQITRENHTAVSIRHLITPSPISTKSKWWSLLPG